MLVHNQCGDSPQSPVKLSKHELKGIDAHAFKQDMVGGSISRWDIFKDSANQNAIWLGDKAQKVWMATGYVPSEFKNVYPR